LNLTDAQLEYLRTGKTNDPDVFLDWAYGRNEEEVRRVFEAIRGDYSAGHFEWAEKEFGGKR
jgi:hypothetical protein